MAPRVLLIDNYDSFVYNLAQYLGALGAEPVVVRNDVPVKEVAGASPDAIVISPGPGRPEDSGCSLDVISTLGARIPILGVCLGHQAIGVAYGARVVRAARVMHGKLSQIQHGGEGVFSGLPTPFLATRYHSLVVDPASLPGELEVTASTDDGVVMGLKHRRYPIEGVQFHPESVLTSPGMDLIANFLARAKAQPVAAPAL